jgi:sugar phosphate isomerase/epimerase
MPTRTNRRDFLKQTTAMTAGVGLAGVLHGSLEAADAKQPLYKISLAEWSLHKTLFGGQLENLEFPRAAKEEFGIEAVELVNQFFRDKAQDKTYLTELKSRAGDLGVSMLLIMIDGEGRLGDPTESQRKQAVQNHHKWVEAAKFLECHSIRVNAASEGPYEQQLELAADGLRRLSEFGAEHGLGVIVENHGGLSSNGKWLASVIKKVDLPNCGTLPDFGNFGDYDRYQGVEELMPFAKGVSAKSHDFDDSGNETRTDYLRMMKIVLDANYHGYVGIEYEGSKLGEYEGIRATKKLLERVREQLA